MPSPLPRVGAVQLRARAGEGARMERGAGVEAAQLRQRGRGSGAAGGAVVEGGGGVEGARRVLLLWRFCGAFGALLSAVEGSKKAAKGQRIERGARGR